MIDAYGRLDDWRATSRWVRREHRAMLQAIEDRDGERAVELLRGHINDFYDLDDDMAARGR
ncbi:FCD domain-containing protein [Saccharopolyspora mangrovi]|uniref:FCD domain-containing protein n=1 Tax=Saccharopolyspora mangrovi TaxID=3082379 RepID=A0ABU6A9U3_9PSEU|nr:FCD domain-containing protein [Saccharopolyspora sp. S2-29]MEB3368261.1 FCD domain-containing protein [Saccharopolyspora sp. S2-29]